MVGKLGEIAFAYFLHRNNKRIIGNNEMFEIWEDVYAADRTDFLTSDGRTIDIKTASKDFHRRITIPAEQFLNRPSNFYVGIRIAEDQRTARIVGYSSHDRIRREGIHRGPNSARNYRYASYDIDLHQLSHIQGLFNLIDNRGLTDN